MNRKRVSWLIVIIWCGLIFSFTASPLFTGDHTAQWIRDILQTFHFGHTTHVNDGFFSWNYIIRKLTHLSVFGILSIILWRALNPRRHAKFWAWLLTVIYAASDEWHQSFQPDRSPEVTDVMIDACGAFIALYLLVPIVIRIYRRKAS